MANIYKFQDKREFDYCFVIAQNLKQAEGMVRDLTEIPVEFIEHRPIKYFPSAMEIYEHKGCCIMVNRILPF